jgi:hypothetical protein
MSKRNKPQTTVLSILDELGLSGSDSDISLDSEDRPIKKYIAQPLAASPPSAAASTSLEQEASPPSAQTSTSLELAARPPSAAASAPLRLAASPPSAQTSTGAGRRSSGILESSSIGFERTLKARLQRENETLKAQITRLETENQRVRAEIEQVRVQATRENGQLLQVQIEEQKKANRALQDELRQANQRIQELNSKCARLDRIAAVVRSAQLEKLDVIQSNVYNIQRQLAIVTTALAEAYRIRPSERPPAEDITAISRVKRPRWDTLESRLIKWLYSTYPDLIKQWAMAPEPVEDNESEILERLAYEIQFPERFAFFKAAQNALASTRTAIAAIKANQAFARGGSAPRSSGAFKRHWQRLRAIMDDR